VEDHSEVILSLAGIGKSTVRSNVRRESIDSSRSPRDVRSTELLHRSDSSKGPEITIRDPRELLLDLLHVVSGEVESVVRAVLSKGTKENEPVSFQSFETSMNDGEGWFSP